MENEQDSGGPGSVVDITSPNGRRPASRKPATRKPRKRAAASKPRKGAAPRRRPAARRRPASGGTTFEGVIRSITGGVTVARAAIAEASGHGASAVWRDGRARFDGLAQDRDPTGARVEEHGPAEEGAHSRRPPRRRGRRFRPAGPQELQEVTRVRLRPSALMFAAAAAVCASALALWQSPSPAAPASARRGDAGRRRLAADASRGRRRRGDRPATAPARDAPAAPRSRGAPGRRGQRAARGRRAGHGRRGRVPLADARGGRAEPGRAGPRRRPRPRALAGAVRGAAARRRAAVLHARVRLRLHALGRRGLLEVAARGAARGRGARHPPLPAAGARRDLLGNRPRRPRTAPGLRSDRGGRVRGGRRREGGSGSRVAGETPWSPKAFYRETGYWRGEGTTVVVQTGGTDPLTGRSFYQIAMASRSLHRSQDMGTLQEPGPNRTEVGWVAGGAGREGKDLFAGVDTRLAAIAAEVPDAARRGEMERRLTRAAELAVQARASLSAPDLGSAAPKIAEALRELRGARELVRPGDGGVAMLLDEKIVIAERALASAASVTLDAIAEREVSSPGESVEVTASVWNAGKEAVEVSAVSLESPDGWSAGAPARAAASRRITSRSGRSPRRSRPSARADRPLLPREADVRRSLRLDGRPARRARRAVPARRLWPRSCGCASPEPRSRSPARCRTGSATRRPARCAGSCARRPPSRSASSRTSSSGGPARRRVTSRSRSPPTRPPPCPAG